MLHPPNALPPLKKKRKCKEIQKETNHDKKINKNKEQKEKKEKKEGFREVNEGHEQPLF